MRWLLALTVLGVLAAPGLAVSGPLDRDPQVDAELRSAFDQLRHHEDDALLARLAPAARKGAAAQLPAVEAYLPPGEPRGRTVVGTNTALVSGQGETVSATDDYDYGDRVAEVDIRMHRAAAGQPWRLLALHVQAGSRTQIEANNFTLMGKSPLQYLFLAFAIAAPLSMIAALVKVIRTRGLRFKWLWAVVAFLGVFTLRMNWTTGELAYQLLTIQLIGAGVTRGLGAFSQWVVSTTVPVGAILILFGVWANPGRARSPSRPAVDHF